jgi:hypothetical protein
MTIKVNLGYYNKKHEDLITNTQPYVGLGTAGLVTSYLTNPEIRKVDFLSYYLLHRQPLAKFKTYQELKKKIHAVSVWIEDVLVITGNKLTLVQKGYRDNSMADNVGESIGLSVVSRLHGLTDADWTRLDTLPGVNGAPSFDFQIASNGTCIIQVETKGSFVDNCTKKPSAVSNHAKEVLIKKTGIAAAVGYPYPASVRYGTIAALDHANDTQCWLLDPEATQIDLGPTDMRIAKRLGYAAKLISLLAPTAKLPYIITERIDDILREGADRFDGKRLTTYRGGPGFSNDYVESYLAKNKVYLDDLDVVGRIFPGADQRPHFIGMRASLVRQALAQDFGAVAETHFSESDMVRREMNVSDASTGASAGKPVMGIMNLRTSSGGLVLGHLEG